MDKDRIEGKMEDIKGRVKRQTGEWTGDEKTQAEGAADQIKGKIRNAAGKVKDAARDAADEARKKNETDAEGRNDDIERDKNVA